MIIPLTARCKKDLRDIFLGRWVTNFLDIDKCQGMKFHWPRMPTDAINTKMRFWVLVDAAKKLVAVRSGVRFKRKKSTSHDAQTWNSE